MSYQCKINLRENKTPVYASSLEKSIPRPTRTQYTNVRKNDRFASISKGTIPRSIPLRSIPLSRKRGWGRGSDGGTEGGRTSAAEYLSPSFLEMQTGFTDNASVSDSYSRSCRVHAPLSVSPALGSALIAAATSPYATNFHRPWDEEEKPGGMYYCGGDIAMFKLHKHS